MSKLAADPRTKPGKKKIKSGNGHFLPRFITFMFSLGLICALIGMLAVAGILVYFSQGLPDYKTLKDYKPPIVTRAYAADGRLLAEFAAEKRVFVPIESVPERVIHAFLSAEDKNFYSHAGVDLRGILRAAITNVQNYGSGKRLQGASTITQQVAKNFLLSNARSYERKIKEAILARRIEQAFTKDEILELYLNEIFLGARSYGVAAAALSYFAKPMEELNIEEAALLAALPKAPSTYNPRRNVNAALNRRNWVIREMQENGYVSEEDAAAAKEKPIELAERAHHEYVDHPYFAEEVRRELLALFGRDGLYEGGMIVKTTLNPRYQKIAEKALRDGLIAYDKRHGLHSAKLAKIDISGEWKAALAEIIPPPGAGSFVTGVVLKTGSQQATVGLADGSKAVVTYNKIKWASKKGVTPSHVSTVLKKGDVWLFENSGEELDGAPVYWLRQIPKVQGGLVALDPHTGRIFAIVGGFSYAMSQFNRANQAIRQPGSAFKPFVYLTALEKGFTPATLVLDAPFVFDQGPGLDKWRPQNYSEDYAGPTPLRRGLEKSKNLMTVRLADYIGMDNIAATAERFGVMENMPTYLSYALGAGETTLMRMVTGYGVFVNGGKQITPTLIDRIQDRAGKTIYVHNKIPCEGCGHLIPWEFQPVPDVPDMRPQIADPRHMYQMVSLLEGVVQRGTGVRLRDLGRPMAGKTGTTNEEKDTWFVGFTPDLVVGVYVGYDEPKPLGDKETGSRVAVPIIKQFISEALEDVPPVPFRVPPGVRLVQVNAEDGTRAMPEDENMILDVFLEGTEPGDEPMMFNNGTIAPVSDITKAGEDVNMGLGGIY